MAGFTKKTQEEVDRQWAAIRDEVADMIVREYPYSIIRLRIAAFWSVYLSDEQIIAIDRKVARHGRKNAFAER
jgi:hypothetical protein